MNGIRFNIGTEKVQTFEHPDSFYALTILLEKKIPHYQISQIAYEDPDGDLITIKEDIDLTEAYRSGKKLEGFLILTLKGVQLSESFMTHSSKIESRINDIEVIGEEPPAPHSLPAPFEKEDYYVPCYACAGKLDKCVVCSGNGVVDAKKDPRLNSIVDIIRHEMESYLPKLLQAIKSSKSDVVHQNVTCDNCGVSPILGHRYKCSVCQNFDFCGECEINTPHDHPFIKIRYPEQAPKAIFCAIDEEPKSSNKYKPKKNFSKCQKNRQCEAGTRLLCRFVKDVVGHEGDKIQSGSAFVKIWRLRNDGLNTWPSGCKLVCINGDFSGQEVLLPELKPGDEEDVTATCIAPTEEGRYTSYWRAVDPEGSRFGQRVWITINVVKPIQEFDQKVQTLMEMFNNPEVVRMALEKSGGDLLKATEALLSGSII